MIRNSKFASLLTFLVLIGWSRADQPTEPAGAYKYNGKTYVPANTQWLTWSKEINGRDCPADEPYAVNPTFRMAAYANGETKPMDSSVHTAAKIAENPGATDALDEVNAYRGQRGLRPFVRDEGLSIAAGRAAAYRAQHRIEGHVSGGMGDFQFVPAGSFAASAGCAAWPPEMGWGSCCVRDNYTYAGAAWAMGADGQRYMHLFVR